MNKRYKIKDMLIGHVLTCWLSPVKVHDCGSGSELHEVVNKIKIIKYY